MRTAGEPLCLYCLYLYYLYLYYLYLYYLYLYYSYLQYGPVSQSAQPVLLLLIPVLLIPAVRAEEPVCAAWEGDASTAATCDGALEEFYFYLHLYCFYLFQCYLYLRRGTGRVSSIVVW